MKYRIKYNNKKEREIIQDILSALGKTKFKSTLAHNRGFVYFDTESDRLSWSTSCYNPQPDVSTISLSQAVDVLSASKIEYKERFKLKYRENETPIEWVRDFDSYKEAEKFGLESDSKYFTIEKIYQRVK